MKLKPVYDLICEYEPCGAEFTATRSNAVWCSKRCRDRVKYAQNRDQFKGSVRPVYGRPVVFTMNL